MVRWLVARPRLWGVALFGFGLVADTSVRVHRLAERTHRWAASAHYTIAEYEFIRDEIAAGE